MAVARVCIAAAVIAAVVADVAVADVVDIVPLTRLDNGLELCRFRYKGSDHTLYVGVMAQEVQKIDPSAVSRDHDGYLLVDYERIGLRFTTWDEWLARTSASRP